MSKVGAALRNDFPFFSDERTRETGHYLDNAATTQKPQIVIDAVQDFYTTHNANVGRGVYQLAEDATKQYQQARVTVAAFMGAHPHEMVFVPSATYGLNMLAYSWSSALGPQDSIVVSQLEHHANFIPWLMAAKRTGAQLRVIPVDKSSGQLSLDRLNEHIDDSTKIVAISSMSNVIGLPVPLNLIIERSKQVGAKSIVDACQTVPLGVFNVTTIDCDALVFSGHKMGGPTGIGVLYVRKAVQEQTPPSMFGGGMVHDVVDPSVSTSRSSDHLISVREAPHCYEAGTPPIAQAIGLAAAVNYLTSLNQVAIHKHYQELMRMLTTGLKDNSRITIIGEPKQLEQRSHLISFTVDSMHAHDVAAFLDDYGVCVRAGDHCAHPLIHALDVPATVRASLFVYNDTDDIDALLIGLNELPYL